MEISLTYFLKKLAHQNLSFETKIRVLLLANKLFQIEMPKSVISHLIMFETIISYDWTRYIFVFSKLFFRAINSKNQILNQVFKNALSSANHILVLPELEAREENVELHTLNIKYITALLSVLISPFISKC